MTGRAGITRSLIFPQSAQNPEPVDTERAFRPSSPTPGLPHPPKLDKKSRAPRPGKAHTKPPAAPQAEDDTLNVVLCFGDLVRDCRTVTEKLNYLLGDADHFGGNCRAILNLLRHMQRNVEVLITHHEEV